MRTVKDIAVEIEVDDENKNTCSYECGFWVPANRICVLFNEHLEGTALRPIRAERCKKHFST